jgi:hypothetical protein
MHILREYVDRIEGLSGFASEVASNPLSQGVALDINPIWLYAYRLHCAGLIPRFLDGLWPEFGMASHLVEMLMARQAFDEDAIDFDWVDKTGWVREHTQYLRENHGHSLPDYLYTFIVKVITKPISRDRFKERDQLLYLTTRQTFFTMVETRPLGALALSPGDGCNAAGIPGTIGGFLRDLNTGTIYASTCGHVVSSGVNVTDASGKQIGICRHSKAPHILSSNQYCRSGDPGTNKLDFALMDCGKTAGKNTVSGKAAQIVPHQTIILRGAASKVNAFEVGAHMITYCPGTSNTCFEKMFEVRPRASSGLLNARVHAAITPLPTQGDSGGWVETSSKEWCGVLIAADHLMGYALEADDIVAQADVAFGTQLQLT